MPHSCLSRPSTPHRLANKPEAFYPCSNTTYDNGGAAAKADNVIVFLRMFIPELAESFMRFGSNNRILKDGAIRAVLSAYAVPIKLKYECLLSLTFGKGALPRRLLRCASSRSSRGLCHRLTRLVLVRFSHDRSTLTLIYAEGLVAASQPGV